MRAIFTPLLLLTSSLCFAQHYDRNGRFYNDQTNYAVTELALNAGPCFFSDVNALTLNAQVTVRPLDHLQVSPMISAITAQHQAIVGAGLNLNFPIGVRRSYFYPGAQIGYYFQGGVVYGIHIGFTAALSRFICLNIEPNMVHINPKPAQAGYFYPITAGLRFGF